MILFKLIIIKITSSILQGVIAGLIALLGTALTVTIGFIQYKKQNWGQLVSASRNKWLNDVREE